MLLGFATWLYTLLLPAMTMAGWVDAAWVQHGPFGISGCVRSSCSACPAGIR